MCYDYNVIETRWKLGNVGNERFNREWEKEPNERERWKINGLNGRPTSASHKAHRMCVCVCVRLHNNTAHNKRQQENSFWRMKSETRFLNYRRACMHPQQCGWGVYSHLSSCFHCSHPFRWHCFEKIELVCLQNRETIRMWILRCATS